MTLPGGLGGVGWGCCEGARIPAPSPESDTGQNQNSAFGARGGCLPAARGFMRVCVGTWVGTWVRAWVHMLLHGGLAPNTVPSHPAGLVTSN